MHADPAALPETPDATTPLVVHVIHRLQVGGLENGLVNLINTMPPAHFRHAIVCMTDHTDFIQRLKRPDVAVYKLEKRPGHDLRAYLRFWRLIRRLRPAIVHTRNYGTLDMQFFAWLARVPVRIHGEHGRDSLDVDGSNRKYLLLRKIFKRFVSGFTTVSKDLENWLGSSVGISADRIRQLYTGVDANRFSPGERPKLLPEGFVDSQSVVFGTVGHLRPEKDQLTLVRAFAMLNVAGNAGDRARLVLVGEGVERSAIEAEIRRLGLVNKVWLAGQRYDTDQLYRTMDIFVLPSLGEGIPNSVLEAMACGKPVIATRVGGCPELVEDGVTGRLVPSAMPDAMAQAMREYLEDADLRRDHGLAARQLVVTRFSLQAMADAYADAYRYFQSTTIVARNLSQRSS